MRPPGPRNQKPCKTSMYTYKNTRVNKAAYLAADENRKKSTNYHLDSHGAHTEPNRDITVILVVVESRAAIRARLATNAAVQHTPGTHGLHGHTLSSLLFANSRIQYPKCHSNGEREVFCPFSAGFEASRERAKHHCRSYSYRLAPSGIACQMPKTRWPRL